MSTKHSLIQERLNLKRAPLDEWNTHEQLCLASAVASSGDQNWMSVSRALKGIVKADKRPADWFVSKSCATQYGKLLESVDTPKRKKRTASERDQPVETPSTPVESLVKKLTTERIIELKNAVVEDQREFAKLKEEILFLQSSSMDESRIREMWSQIEQEKIQKEHEQVRYDQWLKEREEKRIEIERQWRPNYGLNKSPNITKTQKLQVQEAMDVDAVQQQAVAQSAPTLVTLLDKKPSTLAQDRSTSEKQQLMMSISVAEGSGGKDGADAKDEEADILADFNELIADKFDDEDLEDINSIIMNPEILDDKLADDEPSKDVDDSSQATSTDDYDKLKIVKQLVEDFGGVPEIPAQVAQPKEATVDDSEVVNVPSEPETSNPASVEVVEQTESNDSKVESPAPDDSKVLIISDESSNTNDEKKVETGEKGEESQSVKSPEADASGEETRAFKVIQESEENSASSEKEAKEPLAVYQVDDSDEDVLFEDAKEHHDDSTKIEKEAEATESKVPEKAPEIKEIEEATRSAGSIDSDDEVLEVKAFRSTGRKKNSESLKAEAPSSSTRSRDHSENDDTRDTSIRTRSRHSSIIPAGETKSTFNFSKEQDHSMWKARWEDCQKELQMLKDYAAIVDSKIIPDDSYKSVILCPMNMKTIQKKIESHVSTVAGDVKRDFALMCSNIIMLNKKGWKFNETVNQFIKDGLDIIDSNLEVEDAYKSYRKQIKKKH